MKQHTSSEYPRVWKADLSVGHTALVNGVKKRFILMFLWDSETDKVTGYTYLSLPPTNLSLIRLLNAVLIKYEPPEFIIADFLSDFSFDSWGPGGHQKCHVIQDLPWSSVPSFSRTGYIARQIRQFMDLHFKGEDLRYETMLMVTDALIDKHNLNAERTKGTRNE